MNRFFIILITFVCCTAINAQTVSYYKLTKKVNASTPAIKVLKKFISNWRTPIKEQKDWPDYILSTCNN